MDKFCENCGYKLNANDKFCEKCGSKIEEKDKPKKATLIENNMGENINNNGSNTLFCIIGIIVVIIIIFGVISLFTGGGTSVNGVSFNIPDGYKSDNYVTSQWENPNVKNYEVKGYSNDYGDTIAIVVSDVSKNANIYSVTDGKPITIHGKEGVIQYFSGKPVFMYIENGKYIGISAPDKSTINEIIR